MNNTSIDNNINDEKWKRVADFPSYEISNFGRVRNASGKVLKPQKNKTNGYYQIMLHNGINGNKIKLHYLHRLVATYFLPPPADGQTQINHKNGDRQNNTASNLQWKYSSDKENFNAGIKVSRKVRVYKQAPTPKYYQIIRQLTQSGFCVASYLGYAKLKEKGYNPISVKNASKGKHNLKGKEHRKYKGYYWQIINIQNSDLTWKTIEKIS